MAETRRIPLAISLPLAALILASALLTYPLLALIRRPR